MTIHIFISLGLEPIQYSGPDYFNGSSPILNITSSSDFENITLACSVDERQNFPCSNHTVENSNCTTIFHFRGSLGCNYSCFFTVKKPNYSDEISNGIRLTTCEHLLVHT